MLFILILLSSSAYFFYFTITKDKVTTGLSANIPLTKKRLKITNQKPITIESNTRSTESTSEKGLKKNDNGFDSQPIVVETKMFDINTSFDDQKYYSSFLESFNKGDFKNGLVYGKNLLQIPDKYSKEYWYGNVIHNTNIILGKINFALGNIPESEFYLLNSVNPKYISKTQDGIYSPQLSTFGPDTSLAYDLYKSGRRVSVLKYFQSLKSFWKFGVDSGYIDNSITNIQNGAKVLTGNSSENNYNFGEYPSSSFPFKQGPNVVPYDQNLNP